MSVKAKFICNSVIPNSWNDGSTTVTFNAIFGNGTQENADYSAATPSGSLSMMISKDTKASTFFKQGKSYYLTLEEAPE